ncbi:MAG: hypothetical protein LBQ16_02890 [Gracilibacteraceae bacterium]|jgi:hypothetical protein|nr:hypothetical protein [Gracilibacteraceae bacterium]
MKGYVGIKTPEEYTVESLYELMQREGKFELPYEISGQGMMQTIQFPLNGNNVIQIAARKKSISVSVAKANKLKDVAIWAITDGWSDVFDRSKKDNQGLLETVAAEIRRITSGK